MPPKTTTAAKAAPNPMEQWLDLAWYPAARGLEFWRESLEAYNRAALGAIGPVSLWGASLQDAAEPAPPKRTFRRHRPGTPISKLSVGDSATYTKSITQDEIEQFALISGDDNPAHVNERWAKKTRLKTRVAHGVLTGGLISAALGTKLPGPGSIYMSQSFKWLAPVYPGDELTARVTITGIDEEKKRVVLETVVEREGTAVLTGEALVMPPAE